MRPERPINSTTWRQPGGLGPVQKTRPVQPKEPLIGRGTNPTPLSDRSSEVKETLIGRGTNPNPGNTSSAPTRDRGDRVRDKQRRFGSGPGGGTLISKPVQPVETAMERAAKKKLAAIRKTTNG